MMTQLRSNEMYRQRLTDLREETRARILQTAEALAEETNPCGEHEVSPSEGVDAEMVRERANEDLLRSIEDALGRIDREAFGICIECGRAIPGQRLEAVPYTAYCIRCERAHEQTS